MKVLILAVCLSLFVASQAFILNDGFRDIAMLNMVSGRSPLDFAGLFGGQRPSPVPAAPATGAAGQPAGTGVNAAAVAAAAARYRTNRNPFNNLLGLSLIGDMGFF